MNLEQEFFIASLVLNRDAEAIRNHIARTFQTRSWIQYGYQDAPIIAIGDVELWASDEFQELVLCVQRHARLTGFECAVCLIQGVGVPQ